jgi:hypothetical protein
LGYQWDDPEITSLEDCRYYVAVEAKKFTPKGEVVRYFFPPMTVAQVAIRGGLDLEWSFAPCDGSTARGCQGVDTFPTTIPALKSGMAGRLRTGQITSSFSFNCRSAGLEIPSLAEPGDSIDNTRLGRCRRPKLWLRLSGGPRRDRILKEGRQLGAAPCSTSRRESSDLHLSNGNGGTCL